ncbi:cadherin-like domain-containing protein [Synechococcus sp. MIT S9451]|uniref:cadherin-like domain-containing protein n=1 Tax=Synechococcus sp. MIT S9451 TaxID=3082543 RepID=UPI0039B42D4E
MGSENLRPGFNPDGSVAKNITINGTNQSEKLSGGYGHDTIHGNAGNDTIDGLAGSDTIHGGDGNDNITGNFGDDRLYGEAGDDTLSGGDGNDELYGGEGSDYLSDNSGSNKLDGGEGNDEISVNAGRSTQEVNGGSGRDTIRVRGSMTAKINGGGHGDKIWSFGVLNSEIYGGTGSDYIENDYSTDAKLYGDSGADNIVDYGSTSVYIDGGEHGDFLRAWNNKNANIKGGNGSDSITSYTTRAIRAQISIDGGAGDDRIQIHSQSGASHFEVNGGSGNDKIELVNSNRAANYFKLAGGEGNDIFYANLVSFVGSEYEISGGDGFDTLNLRGEEAYYEIKQLNKQELSFEIKLKWSEKTHHLKGIEAIQFSDQEISLENFNRPPILNGAQATLTKGKEDTAYIIKEADLLHGFSDVDGDKLKVKNLSASAGSLHTNNDGTWTYSPEANDNGTIKLDYTVSDGNGGELKASNSFGLEAVNDAPTVSGPIDLGAIDEDGSIRITKEQLLKKSSDVDGDVLSISDLKVSQGDGTLKTNSDGSWSFTPSKDWNGGVDLEYSITDNGNQKGTEYSATMDLLSRSYSIAARHGQNSRGIAAIRKDGSLVGWEKLNSLKAKEKLSSGIKKVFSSKKAFAALKEDGSVVTWGDPYSSFEHDPKMVELLSSNVSEVYSSNGSSFAALKTDNSAIIWGENEAYRDNTKFSYITSGAKEIHANRYGYAVVKENGLEVINDGKVTGREEGQFKQIVASDGAFAFIRKDGSVGFIGSVYFGQNHHARIKQKQVLSGPKVTRIYASASSFALLREDGSVTRVGHHATGGHDHNDSQFESELARGVVDITPSSTGFAALKEDGSVYSWGGDVCLSKEQAVELSGSVKQIYSSNRGFAALKQDGSVVTWGHRSWGHRDLEDGAKGIEKIFPSHSGFLGLKKDGSLAHWGHVGNNDLSRLKEIKGNIKEVKGTDSGWAILTNEGNIITVGSIYYNSDRNGISNGDISSLDIIGSEGKNQFKTISTNAFINVRPINDAPEVTGDKAALDPGHEDICYTFKESDLLKGWSDVEGDELSIKNLKASAGKLTDLGDGNWALHTPKDFNGKIELSYSVADVHGAATKTSQNIKIKAVNDAPIVTAPVDLGAIDEDGSIRITKEQLLKNSSDIDGDALSISDLKVRKGDGTLKTNSDGSWTFKPNANWHGEIEVEYAVQDWKTVDEQKTFNRFPTTISYAVWDDGQLKNETREIRSLPFNLTYAVKDGSGFRNESKQFNTFPSTLNYLTIDGGGASVRSTAQLTVNSINDGPELTGDKAALDPGHEDICYTIKESELLKGWSDVEGDAISIKNLKASTGKLTDLGDGNWALHTPKDFNGTVQLSYSVADVHGAATQTTHSIEINPVNDAPESKPIELKIEAEHPEQATVSLEKLLSGSWDVDGDQLNVKNVRGSKGERTSQNKDGSWNVVTNGDNGDYTLLFDVTDGELSTQAEATIKVKHRPVFTTFDIVTSSVEAWEGSQSRIEIRRSGNLVTQQVVKLQINSGDITNQDIQLGTAVFKSGSSQAFVDLAFNNDGLWEGIEKGQIGINTVVGPKSVICNWKQGDVDICINDPDSLHDGTGNHQSENDFGVAGAIQQRLAKEAYGDGKNTPGGSNRESARVISNEVIDQTTKELNQRQLSDFVWAWGQFIDHDIVSTSSGSERFAISIPKDDFLRTNKDLEFCDQPNEVINGGIYSAGRDAVPAHHFAFTRSQGFSDSKGVRQHKNQITSFLDGSVVYGASTKDANQLRSFKSGKLKIGSDGLLPVINTNKGDGFLAGDHRAAENPLLSSLQALWVREHNRICDELSHKAHGLSDEKIYQKARTKVMGLLQHITYDEFLPALLGEDALTDYKGYDDKVNPGIYNEFSTAAYRFGHSMISNTIARRDHDGSESKEGDIQLRDAFFNIQILQQSGIETVLRGASLQQAQEVDSQYTDGLRNFLFAAPPEGSKCPMRGVLRFANGAFPALDLGSRNVQRGRDHGLAHYNDMREAMGLKRAKSFEDITSDKELAKKLSDLYNGDINNVDLYVAGLSEDHTTGSSVGELFGSIITKQFQAIRDGDRFWYENNKNKLFTTEEIAEIKTTSLADVIERNTDITGLRSNVFVIGIKGTDGDDVLQGTDLADHFCASLGSDVIKGGEGFDSVDYKTIEGPVTLRFDGVLKGSNLVDELGLSAWEGLQDLANQGNKVAKRIFSLHTSFFGRSTSGFFDNGQKAEATIMEDAAQPASSDIGFDHLSDIESIEAKEGSSIDARGATESVEVDLSANTFKTNFFGRGLDLAIKGFSNVFGSRNKDSLKGDKNNNILVGMDGNDAIEGGAGNDLLLGGHGDDVIKGDAGNDKIDGGSGIDTAVYSGDKADYTVKRTKGIVTIQDHRQNTNEGTDRLENVERFQFNDGEIKIEQLNKGPQLTDAKAQLQDGYKNWTYIIKEADLLQGYTDENEDLLKIKNLETSTGKLKDLGNGSWQLSGLNPKFEGKVLLTYFINDGHGGELKVSQEFNIKQAILEGTNQTEELKGTGKDEWIYAYNGFDTIRTAGGDDRAYGGYGNDTIYGGFGNDQLHGEQDDDILRGGSGDDELYGGTGNDNLKGGDGDDRLTGGEGADTLDGGNGSDTYFVDDERDTIKDTGTSGTDTVYYRYLSNKYEIGEGIEKVVLPGSAIASSIMVMGNAGNNDITSGDGDDTVMAGDGDDTIYTGSGDDKVEAGNGNDLIIGGEGAGDDSYDGGSGVDTIKYTSATDDIVVDLSKGIAGSKNGSDKAGIGSDTLTGIESVIGSYYDDLLIGDSADNIFEAERGNDTIKGGRGNDIAVYSGKLSDYSVKRNGDGTLTVTDKRSGSNEGTDTLSGVEKLKFSNQMVSAAPFSELIESNGNVHLHKDSSGMGWVKLADGSFDDITAGGQRKGENSYFGWSQRAAETINGVNTLIWTNTDGRMSEWTLDSNWNLSNYAIHSNGSEGFSNAELAFNQDFNNDKLIGRNTTAVESNGNVHLHKDSAGMGWVKLADGSFDDITAGGQRKGEGSYQGWSQRAAESINGTNKLIWTHVSGAMSEWTLDSNWNLTNYAIHSNGSEGFSNAELAFNQDFNNDKLIGTPYTATETQGSFHLVKDALGGAYARSGASGPLSAISYQGNQMKDGYFPGWSLVGTESINGTNHVAWQHSAGAVSIWNTDANWAYTGIAFIGSPNSDQSLQFESSFNQDFNNDSIIGTPYTATETQGSFHLVKDALGGAYARSGASGPLSAISYQGNQMKDGYFPGWSLVGTESINGTNHVAWKHSAGAVSIWNTDANWAYTGIAFIGSPNSAQSLQFESSFNQDFNNDSIIGTPYTATEIQGSFHLVKDALGGAYARSGASGPLSAISYQGNQMKDGFFAGWSLVGTESINGTNHVAWQHSAGAVSIWNTDANWAYTGIAFIGSPNSDQSLQFESSFNQDFNNDSIIGTPYTATETQGSFHLVKDALGGAYARSGASGPLSAISYQGNQMKDGYFPGWSLVGTESINGTNHVAWKHSAGAVSIWNTDANWAYTGIAFIGSPNSAQSLQFESSFNQDFNNDSIIGTPYTATEIQGSFHLVKDALGGAYARSGSSGPLSAISYQGNQMKDGFFPGWSLIGTESINGTNHVVWKHSAGAVSIWNTDANWAYTGIAFIGSPNSDQSLQFESSFNQDFNNDSIIGIDPLT